MMNIFAFKFAKRVRIYLCFLAQLKSIDLLLCLQLLLMEEWALLPPSVCGTLAACGFRPFLRKCLSSQILVGSEFGNVNGRGRWSKQLVLYDIVNFSLKSIHIILIERLQPRLSIIIESPHGLLPSLWLRIKALCRFRDTSFLRRGKVADALQSHCLRLGPWRESLIVQEC